MGSFRIFIFIVVGPSRSGGRVWGGFGAALGCGVAGRGLGVAAVGEAPNVGDDFGHRAHFLSILITCGVIAEEGVVERSGGKVKNESNVGAAGQRCKHVSASRIVARGAENGGSWRLCRNVCHPVFWSRVKVSTLQGSKTLES